jgi:hypothetical protein
VVKCLLNMYKAQFNPQHCKPYIDRDTHTHTHTHTHREREREREREKIHPSIHLANIFFFSTCLPVIGTVSYSGSQYRLLCSQMQKIVKTENYFLDSMYL